MFNLEERGFDLNIPRGIIRNLEITRKENGLFWGKISIENQIVPFQGKDSELGKLEEILKVETEVYAEVYSDHIKVGNIEFKNISGGEGWEREGSEWNYLYFNQIKI